MTAVRDIEIDKGSGAWTQTQAESTHQDAQKALRSSTVTPAPAAAQLKQPIDSETTGTRHIGARSLEREWFSEVEAEAPTLAPLPWLETKPDTQVSRVRLRVVPHEPPAQLAPTAIRSLPRASVAPRAVAAPAPDTRLEKSIIELACKHPSWGAVKLCSALMRHGFHVSVRDVGRVLARHGAWGAAGRIALRRSLKGDVLTERTRINHVWLLGFEILAFVALGIAVTVAWFAL